MLGRGKKTREWEAKRRRLKQRFEAVGLTTCEFRYEGCWIDNGLSFAHIKKRLNLLPGELEVVALACPVCHHILDNRMKEAEMTKTVLAVIQKRICQP
jgi:hypothetical protein